MGEKKDGVKPQPKKQPRYKKYTAAEKKQRYGRDLVSIFYALGIFAIAMMTTHFIVYNIGALGYKSLFVGLVPLFNLFGIDPLTPITSKQFAIPYNMIIDSMTAYTGVYGALEGTTSVVKTLGVSRGESTPMPEYKIKRFLRLIVFWFCFATLAAIFQVTIHVGDATTFYVDKVFAGLAAATLTYIYGRQGSKTVENVNIKQFTPTTQPVVSTTLSAPPQTNPSVVNKPPQAQPSPPVPMAAPTISAPPIT
jgi:hypothetical protein